MAFQFSHSDLHLLQHEADVAARRLARQLQLPSSDLADVRQDLPVDGLAFEVQIAQSKDGGSMIVVKPSPFDLAETYRDFWAAEQAAAERRMEDPAILETALRSMAAETQRRLPIRWQVSIYEALRDAEIAKRRFLAEQSRRAGSAEKTDALQTFIIEATVVQLLDKLSSPVV
jgi:hypothetical protein